MHEHRLLLPPEVAQRFACHEAGHTIIAWFRPIRQNISVRMPTFERPQGQMMPETIPTSTASRFQEWLVDREHGFGTWYGQHEWEALIVYLGGLAGEGIGLKTVKTKGAELDLKNSLDTAQRIVKNNCVHNCPWPESPEPTLGDISLLFSSRPSYEVTMVLNRGYRFARHMIRERKDKFDFVALALLDEWSLSHERLTQILGKKVLR